MDVVKRKLVTTGGNKITWLGPSLARQDEVIFQSIESLEESYDYMGQHLKCGFQKNLGRLNSTISFIAFTK